METLLEISTGKVEYKGRKYRVNDAYDNVLLLQCLYEEEELDTGDKIRQALKLLVRNYWRVRLLNPWEQAELLQKITKEYIDMPKKSQTGTTVKLIDIRYDGSYIYASFKQAYGMDLLQERGHLSWHRFMDLLEGLPEKTKIKEVMKIRAMDLPEPTQYNQKEIRNMMELKSYYALPVKGGGGQEGLDMLFSTLERMAQ